MPLLSAPSRARLRTDVEALFRPPPASDGRVGVEVEVIPVCAESGGPVHPLSDGGGTLPVLRELARCRGWTEEPTRGGVPRFILSQGGVVSFEPGGQIEFASTPARSLDLLDAAVREILDILSEAMERAGVRLLARGVDPLNRLDAARLILGGERYPRQREHYDRRGEAGRRMMLQSAALHVNLDFGGNPLAAWSAANLVVPHLVAIFANSSRQCGGGDARRSQRAALWRALDPTRTGAFAPSDDPVADYLEFALKAESFLLGERGAPSEPYEAWHAREVGDRSFPDHLTTLFPEVRPRGYLEIRSVDALPARWCIVPAALAAAVVSDTPARAAVLREIPSPTADRLERAGRLGLRDPELSAEVGWLREWIPEGLRALGEDLAGRVTRRRVQAFFEAFTDRGFDPGVTAEDSVGA